MSAPRLTVVLTVYRDQAYVHECVSSVLGQSFRDVELVAVDNATPDHGAEILDELAEEDPRLVVRRLDTAVSLGEARNVGLEAATGDYVWFVETTDVVPPGAMAAVAARLDAVEPDVLVVDHTRTRPLGRAKPSPHRRVLRAASRVESFALDDRPEAVGLGIDVWDKIVRTEFLRKLRGRFTPGRYGELAVTYPALLAAERISALDRVSYERRRPANAADEPHVHGTHFDVFAQYDVVFRFADARGGALARWRQLLALSMLRHYISILDDVGDDRRAAFFARMAESYRRHGSGHGAIPGGRGLRLTAFLVEQGRYAPFGALRWVRARRPAARRRVRAVRRWPRTAARAWRKRGARAQVARRTARTLSARYRRPARLEPDLAVFAAYWYRGYSCNPRAIYEKLRETAPWVRGVWIVDADRVATMPEGVEYVVAGTRDYYGLLARAKYFVNNVNFPNELVKREGTIHVQTHHGTPLKKMGLDLRDAFVAGSKMNFEALLRRSARWDYSISSNAYSTLVWERTYPLRYETLEVGYPRNDVLVNATDGDVERIRKGLGIAPAQRAVLYAPTHREYLSGYMPTVDLERLADELGNEYVIMARAHYFYGSDGRLQDLHRAGRILDVGGHESVEELCLAADVLVTDYSALMFDYGVLDRPIVIHAPDWDEYRTLRGTYFDLLAEPPGVVTTTDDELVAAFQTGAVEAEEAAHLRGRFRARFCYLDDGRAAERVVRKVWLAESEKPMREPEPVLRPPLRVGV